MTMAMKNDGKQVPLFFSDERSREWTLPMDGETYAAKVGDLRRELSENSTDFKSRMYQGHMNYDITTPHVDGIQAALEWNQNNVALESSGQTTKYELALVDRMKTLAGYGQSASWGYVCSGGSSGNIMGLWIARERARRRHGDVRHRPDLVMASKYAHYSVAKACNVLDLQLVSCDVDKATGRMMMPTDLVADRVLAIVVTIGTTERGVVDDVRTVLAVARAGDIWIHADAAYGGFFALAKGELSETTRASFDALGECDSFVVDMHKMGYAPYVAAVFMIRDGEHRKFVDCTTGVRYVDSHISSAWTIEGTRSGALVTSAYFGQEIVGMQKYTEVMSALLRGVAILKRALRENNFVVIEPTDLGMVLFLTSDAERMPYYARMFSDVRNTRNGKLTMVTTVLDGYSVPVFRVVVMDPSFETYATQFVAQLKHECEDYGDKFEAHVDKCTNALLGICVECDTPKELRELVSSGKRFVAYNGFEPSGRMHIAQAVTTVLNTNTIVASGGRMIIYIADWFAQLNHKMGGDLARIKEVGRYFIEVFKAIGIDTVWTDFVWASDFIKSNPRYWQRVLDISMTFNVSRILRCCQIMGRREKDSLSTSQYFYPCMQCADVFELGEDGVDICQLGLDQRKVNMLAREFARKKNIRVPIILSHQMILGLKYKRPRPDAPNVAPPSPSGEPEDAADRDVKMSKSDPESAIFMDDSTEDVYRKIRNAFCDDEPRENPIFDYIKHILIRWYGKVRLCGKEYGTADDVAVDFAQMDKCALKKDVAQLIDAIVERVRRHFDTSDDMRELSRRIIGYRTTR
jgi:tyrosyl-tRNA synthetase